MAEEEDREDNAAEGKSRSTFVKSLSNLMRRKSERAKKNRDQGRHEKNTKSQTIREFLSSFMEAIDDYIKGILLGKVVITV